MGKLTKISLLLLVPFNLYAAELTCTDEEFTTFMDSYKKGVEEQQKSTFSGPTFKDFSEARRARRNKEDPKNFCEYTMDAEFDLSMTMPDWSKITAAWDALGAMMNTNAKGVDVSAVVSKAMAKGIEKAKEEINKGTCELAEFFDTGAKEMFEEAVEDQKDLYRARLKQKAKERGLDEVHKDLEAKDYESLLYRAVDDDKFKKDSKDRQKRFAKFKRTD